MNNESLSFMKQPLKWPNWPLLPVKRYHPKIECGIMIDHRSALTTVFIRNLFALEGATGTLTEDFINHSCVKYNYPDYQALVADGWMVD